MSIPSPYTPGRVPHVFSGRRTELDEARQLLGSVATYHQFAGRIHVHTGVRGVGKTSLLKQLQHEAATAGFIVAWATAREDESLVATLSSELATGLDLIGIDVSKNKRLRDRLTAVKVQVGAGPLKAGAEFDTGARPGEPNLPASQAFRELIAAASDAALERGSAGLCLLIDEFQASPPADMRTLAYAWQELQGHQLEPAATVIAAGLPNAPDALSDAVTFSERFAFRPLGRLADPDAADAVTRPADDVDIHWSSAAIDRIVTHVQGYPYALQVAADATWRTARPETGTTITTHHVEQGLRVAQSEMDIMFGARWSKATPAERRVLTAMAQLGDTPLRRRDIANALNVATTELSVPRRSLIDKGLIEPAGYGELQFAVPGFAAFIRTETGHA